MRFGAKMNSRAQSVVVYFRNCEIDFDNNIFRVIHIQNCELDVNDLRNNKRAQHER